MKGFFRVQHTVPGWSGGSWHVQGTTVNDTPAAGRDARSGGRDTATAAPSDVVRPLLTWFAREGRDLPWRRSRDPWHVWVSEIMLQQTQVDRVRGYFTRFIARFPTVSHLAGAREEEVLRLWEGLGYYRRARQLQAAARLVVAEHDGRVPRSAAVLATLPGVGRYTAGAIASIAFDERAPIIEANSRRVIARLVGHDRPLGGTAGDGPLWEVAERLVPARAPGRFNQALMDLGAMICTPTRPRCDACPLGGACVARRTGRTESIPVRAARPEVRRLRETALVLRRGSRVLVARCPAGAWWEGLWDFPRIGTAEHRPTDRRLGAVAYTVTRHQVRCTVVERSTTGPVAGPARGRRWVSVAALARLPLSAPARRIARLLAPPT
jgi:A/G-specific adenine glycosylase